MSNKSKWIILGLSAISGSAAAFFGARWLLRRKQEPVLQAKWAAGQGFHPATTHSEIPLEGTRYQPADQPDRQLIPSTGTTAQAIESAPPFVPMPVTVEDLASPLAQYLLAFNQLIDLLRIRQQERPDSNGRSLTADDRMRFEETLNRLSDRLPMYGVGDLEEDSPQERLYHLAAKVRDALQNLEYGDGDLFRIYGEVRSQTCQALEEIPLAGSDLVQVHHIYKCG